MIKPDGISMLSTLPTYIEIGKPTGDISISGVITNGNESNFSVSVPISPKATRLDIYATNNNTGQKQLITNAAFIDIYQNSSGETLQVIITSDASGVTIALQISNFTGSDISLIPQTLHVVAVEYQIPF